MTLTYEEAHKQTFCDFVRAVPLVLHAIRDPLGAILIPPSLFVSASASDTRMKCARAHVHTSFLYLRHWRIQKGREGSKLNIAWAKMWFGPSVSKQHSVPHIGSYTPLQFYLVTTNNPTSALFGLLLWKQLELSVISGTTLPILLKNNYSVFCVLLAVEDLSQLSSFLHIRSECL